MSAFSLSNTAYTMDSETIEKMRCGVCFTERAEGDEERVSICWEGHTVCRKCSKKLSSCCFCRSDLLEVGSEGFPKNRELNEVINNTKVICENHKNGCEHICLLPAMKDHVGMCNNRVVSCDLSACGCTWRGLAKDLPAHLADTGAHVGFPLKLAVNTRDAIESISNRVGEITEACQGLAEEIKALKNRNAPVTSYTHERDISDLVSATYSLKQSAFSHRRELEAVEVSVKSLRDDNESLNNKLDKVLDEMCTIRTNNGTATHFPDALAAVYKDAMNGVRDELRFLGEMMLHTASTNKGHLQDALDRIPQKRGLKGEQTASAKRLRQEQLNAAAEQEVTRRRLEWERQVREARAEEEEEAAAEGGAGSSYADEAKDGGGGEYADEANDGGGEEYAAAFRAPFSGTVASASPAHGRRIILDDDSDESEEELLEGPPGYAPTSPPWRPTSPPYSS